MFQDLATLSLREQLHLNRKARAESLTPTFLVPPRKTLFILFFPNKINGYNFKTDKKITNLKFRT